ncbi:MAG TPA: hypothetical protein VH560_13760 [Polyangia bacterium]|jgi:hypothetical protein|nr:hypothetical protein [Polyangia bacterium]
MKSHGLVRRAMRSPLAALAFAPLLACGAPQHKAAVSPAVMPMPEATPAPLAHAPDVDDDVPAAPRPHVDTRACEPAGKSVVVVARDADGRPERWRYFETRHGHRALTCEAADNNGDGKVDARYFYNHSGHLVLEQRDLDFDGNAEFVADYSQFKFAAHTPRARSRDGN